MTKAVVLAGGKGTRLLPYTTLLPKPLMPVGDLPIVELLLRRLARAGITQITLSVGHLSGLIMAYLGAGERVGVRIDYSHEETPLGTAGPLALVKGLDEPFLVMNGDLLTDLDFGRLVERHRASGAAATIGLFQRRVQIELGVIDLDGDHRVARYTEKPAYDYLASMGVYVMDPSVLRYVPQGRRFDLPDLVRALLDDGRHVSGYVHDGYWLDIGNPADYEKAQADIETLRPRLLPGPDAP